MTGGKNLPYCTLYKIGKYGIQRTFQNILILRILMIKPNE